MPTNIEIKARVGDIELLRAIVERISDTPCAVLEQEDTFFNVPQGRLKLRLLGSGQGQLVYYERRDESGPKRSDYMLSPVADPDSLRELLTTALGVRGVVSKTRWLYHVGATRIHLDEVEGLGHYLELEVVLAEGDTPAGGLAEAERLMAELGVEESDLVEGAYIDLLERDGLTD
jgi:predicted adenylyl cyclase CyaB